MRAGMGKSAFILYTGLNLRAPLSCKFLELLVIYFSAVVFRYEKYALFCSVLKNNSVHNSKLVLSFMAGFPEQTT